MKSIFWVFLATYGHVLHAVRSVAFVGIFGSVNVSLFCGAGRDFLSNETVSQILVAYVSSHWWFGEYFRISIGYL